MYLDPNSLLPHSIKGAGGIIGHTIGPIILKLTGLDGSTLIMLAMFMIGLTLYTGLSWLWVIDSIGKFVLNATAHFRNYLSSFKDHIEGRRARKIRGNVLKVEQQINDEREPPKIEPIISEIEPSIRSEMEKNTIRKTKTFLFQNINCFAIVKKLLRYLVSTYNVYLLLMIC